jgi:hypothetical protein
MSAHNIQKPGYSKHGENVKSIIKVLLSLSKPTPLSHAEAIKTNLHRFELLALYGCEMTVLRANRFVSLPFTNHGHISYAAQCRSSLGGKQGHRCPAEKGVTTVEPVHLPHTLRVITFPANSKFSLLSVVICIER